jgi:hypothetical protein
MFKEFWIDNKGKDVYEELVDGLDEDAIHVIEYEAYEQAQNEIISLQTQLDFLKDEIIDLTIHNG